MTELESLARIRALYGSILVSAAAHFGHRAEVLAGIMQRETEGGTSRYLDRPGPAGRGDNGHGHGLCQIDDRSFQQFCAGTDWMDPAKNVDFAARVLRNKRAYIASKCLGYHLSDADLERAAIAAYNCGEGRVVQSIQEGEDVDTHTAHRDYSVSVLRFANIYAGLVAELNYPDIPAAPLT